MSPHVAIIVLNWNRFEDTKECLQSLEKVNSKGLSVSIVVVDNGSDEDCISKIKKLIHQKRNYYLVENKQNLGFAQGNNMGIRFSMSLDVTHVCILNNDTLVDNNFLLEAIKNFEKDPKTGTVTPKIYFAKGFEFHKERYKQAELGKVIWSAGGKIDWSNVYGKNRGVDEVDKGHFDQESEVDFATGACAFYSIEVLKKVGLFDERYFMYMEDVELSVRIHKAGYKIRYAPKSIMWHKVSQSSSIGNKLSDYYITRNRLEFGIKYAPFRAKIALLRESIWLAQNGREWQTIGVRDFYLRKFGKGSFK